MDAGRRHKATESETRHIIIHCKSSSQSVCVMLVPAPYTQVLRCDVKGPSWVPAHTVDCVTGGDAEFGGLTAFITSRGEPALRWGDTAHPSG